MSTLNAELCTPGEQTIYALVTCFSQDDSIALAFLTQSGALSLASCLLALGLIFRNVRRNMKRAPGVWRLMPMDIYLVSLFIADLLLATGFVINGKWVHIGRSQTGNLCSAQAVMIILGSTTVAFNTLAIALHTFVMVWMNKGFKATFAAWIAVSLSWSYTGIYTMALGLRHRRGPDPVFRPAPFWCWIGDEYQKDQVFAAYLWMFSTAFGSLLLYIPLFFWSQGNITIGKKWYKFTIHKRGNEDKPEGLRRRSLSMIAYPLVYSFLVLPMGSIRFSENQTLQTKTYFIAFVTLFALSGTANVLLFWFTRPNLLLRQDDGAVEMEGEDTHTPSDADSIGGAYQRN